MMDKAERNKKIKEQVLARKDELIEITRKLVQIDTVNPPGNNYLDCAKYISSLMQDASLNPHIVKVPEDRLLELAPLSEGNSRYSVLGELRGKKPGKTLHYSGHYDVVPAGALWTEEPFAARVDGGRIYGLGIGDMKAGITSMIMAAKVVQDLELDFSGSVTFSFTPDEETGGQAGVGYLVEQNMVPADYAVISEPSMDNLVKLGHRGVLWLRLTSIGRTAHGSMAFNGINAFENMAKMTMALKELEKRIQARTTKFPTQFEQEKHPMIMVGGVIEGGVNKVNVVPDRCMVSIDRRVLPEESLDEVYQEIVETLEKVKAETPGLSYALEKELEVVGTAIGTEEELVTTIQGCHQKVFGQIPKPIISPGYNDLRYFVDKMHVPTVTYGPGILKTAHTPNEYITIDDLLKTTEVYVQLVCELLSAE